DDLVLHALLIGARDRAGDGGVGLLRVPVAVDDRQLALRRLRQQHRHLLGRLGGGGAVGGDDDALVAHRTSFPISALVLALRRSPARTGSPSPRFGLRRTPDRAPVWPPARGAAP